MTTDDRYIMDTYGHVYIKWTNRGYMNMQLYERRMEMLNNQMVVSFKEK